MKSRIFKPIAAILLAVGLTTVTVSSADAATTRKAPAVSTNDTGWGRK